MKLATALVYVMALLAVVNAYQRVATSAEPDMLTVVGTGTILYLGYACLKEKAHAQRTPVR
jgi:hypothetical protein